jgi:hypothetical protein
LLHKPILCSLAQHFNEIHTRCGFNLIYKISFKVIPTQADVEDARINQLFVVSLVHISLLVSARIHTSTTTPFSCWQHSREQAALFSCLWQQIMALFIFFNDKHQVCVYREPGCNLLAIANNTFKAGVHARATPPDYTIGELILYARHPHCPLHDATVQASDIIMKIFKHKRATEANFIRYFCFK